MIQHSKKVINMLRNLLIILLLGLFFISTASEVSANGTKSLAHDYLLQEVSSQVSEKVNPDQNPNIVVKAMPIDSRVRLTQCHSGLAVEMQNRNRITRHFSVKATCPDEERSWSVYVQVRVYEYIESVVTTTHVAKGELITKDMVTRQLIDKTKVRNKSTNNLDQLVGGRAMRNISRGYQVSGSDVCLVCKGDTVQIVAKLENLSIKTTGTAIENGSFGETIQVKNNSSERIIKGVIGDLRQIFIKL
jgi:flagellar basal body P-ring formation protein FlgA